MTAQAASPHPSAPPVHLAIPADQFYWSVLEAPRTSAGVRPRSTTRRTAVWLYAFEDVLPVPVDSIACAFLKAGDKVVACGLPVAVLTALVGPRTHTLHPDSIPAWILDETTAKANAKDGTPPSPRRLNLLTHSHEPHTVRRARRRLVLHAAAMTTCLLAILTLGVERRLAELNARTADANQLIDSAYARVLPPSASGQPRAVRLASELRALERLAVRPSDTSSRPGGRQPVETSDFDAALALSQLLALVPDMHLACDSLDVTPARATLVATVPTTEDAQRLAKAFDQAGAWQLRQPQVSAENAPDGRPAVRVTITLDTSQPVAMAPEPAP